jgi:aryl-alcohol dehydrogenase-like predicted oxidoreductase
MQFHRGLHETNLTSRSAGFNDFWRALARTAKWPVLPIAADHRRLRNQAQNNRYSRRDTVPLNHYVSLCRSGLRVSPFALGAMNFGEDLGMGSSIKDSEAILARYLDAGGNFIDTANGYTRGHSEKIIGDYFKVQPGRRDRIVIATKFYANLYPGDPNAGGNGRKAIHSQVEQSLRRLQTDYIDLYWMHIYDRFTPLEETLRTVDDLVRAGKVRYFGISDTPAYKLAQAQGIAELSGFTPAVALQIEYSLLERTVEHEILPAARELGMGVTPWGPLKSGALSGKYRRENAGKVEGGRASFVGPGVQEKTYALLDVVTGIAKELDSTPARVALAWVQGRAGITSTILGPRTMEHLEDNLQALELKLTEAQRKTLDEASAPAPYCLDRFLAPPFSFGYGGTTVDGIDSPAFWLQPRNDSERH